MRNSKTVFVLAAFLLLLQLSYAQSSKKEAQYLLQTSEMNDLMVHYQADVESIMRFYSVNGMRPEGGGNQGQGTDSYNTPERRQRLLKLIADYQRRWSRKISTE